MWMNYTCSKINASCCKKQGKFIEKNFFMVMTGFPGLFCPDDKEKGWRVCVSPNPLMVE